MNYDIDLIYSGHGEPLSDIHSLIMERIQKQHKWALRVLQAMGKERKQRLKSAQLFPGYVSKSTGLYFLGSVRPAYVFRERRIRCINKNEEGVLLWETTRVLAPQS
ncbi:hypothetical protein AAAC51_10750 [Priestia megaterium]